MEKSTKKKLLIGGSLLVVAGIAGYFIYRYFKNKKEDKPKEETPPVLDTTKEVSPSPKPKPSSSSGSANYGPFKNSTEVKSFQDWMDSKHPNWVNGKNLNKGSGYGTYGPSTKTAWTSYGTEYTTPVKTPEQLKAEREALWQKLLADAKAAGSPTVVFEGKMYDVNTGQLYVDPKKIVKGDNVWVKARIPYALIQNTGGVSTYTGAGLYTKFNSGASSYGDFYPFNYAGVVQEVNNEYKSVKVKNLQQPAVSDSGNYATEFWMPLDALTKDKVNYSFDGMTVTYQKSTI